MVRPAFAYNERPQVSAKGTEPCARLARNHDACETNLSHYFARKSRLASKKHGLGVG